MPELKKEYKINLIPSRDTKGLIIVRIATKRIVLIPSRTWDCFIRCKL